MALKKDMRTPKRTTRGRKKQEAGFTGNDGVGRGDTDNCQMLGKDDNRRKSGK